jgi:gas vesicle protein
VENNTRALLVGALVGVLAVLSNSLDAPVTAEGVSFVIGKLLVGAAIGAYVGKAVSARISG